MAIDINKIVEDFKRLNWRDPGTWPVLPKLAVLLGILVGIPVAAYFIDWQGQLDELERGRQEESKLKDAYVIKKRQSVNLDLYQQQLREIDTQFGALLRQLPNKSQMDALLVNINQRQPEGTVLPGHLGKFEAVQRASRFQGIQRQMRLL